VIHPRANAREVLRFYREFSSAAADELIVYCVFMTMPGAGPAVALTGCYCGEDLAAGERVLAPLRQFGTPIVDLYQPMYYSELIALLDPTAPDGRNYADTAYSLAAPGDDALDAIVACANAATSPFTSIVMHHVNGAATRIAPDATAYALRTPHYAIVNGAGWESGPAEPHIAWTQESLARMQPFINLGGYINFMGHGGEDEVRASYQANYARLVELKKHYDPENFFRRNQNIRV
jgi:hypothetical protein